MRYYNTSGSITWQNETLCNPTEIGNTINTYSFVSIPTGKYAALVAYDADGKEIHRQPVLPPR